MISKAEYLEEINIITFGNNLKVKPWEYICAKQIADSIFEKIDDSLIKEIQDNKIWIEYATTILSQDNLKKEFKFLMQDYYNKLQNKGE